MNTIGEIIDDARSTVFVYKGKQVTLGDGLEDEMFQPCKVLALANESLNSIMAQMQFERNFKKTFMAVDSNIIAMPEDFLALEKILIYNDSIADASTGAHDGAQSATVLVDSDKTFTTESLLPGMVVENTTDGSRGTITAINSNTQITHSSLVGGTDNVWDSGDTFVIYDSRLVTEQDPTQAKPIDIVDSLDNLNTSSRSIYDYIFTGTGSTVPDGLKQVQFLSGLPSKGMLFQTEDDDYTDNVDIVIFDKRALKRYHVDVIYYPEHKDLTAKTAAPKLKKTFRQLIYSDICQKIALRLGDYTARNQFIDEYDRFSGILENVLNQKNQMTTTRPRFSGVGTYGTNYSR